MYSYTIDGVEVMAYTKLGLLDTLIHFIKFYRKGN